MKIIFKKKKISKNLTIDNIIFDSKFEGNYYLYLKNKVANSEITNLIVHPTYEIQETFKIGKRSFKNMVYTPDFHYIKDGVIYYIECKGWQTDIYMMRKKLFIYKYVRGKKCSFIQVNQGKKNTEWHNV
tara:strand:- start:166 stop:552 length:387 start_codon:yes stop_codon:yes gene_type:complete